MERFLVGGESGSEVLHDVEGRHAGEKDKGRVVK